MDVRAIMTSWDVGFLAWCLAIVPGLLFFFLGFRIADKRNKIRNIPTSTIGSIAMGLVEVKGKVRVFQKTYVSPLSGKECLFFEYEIVRVFGEIEKQLVREDGSPFAGFILEDESGQVGVDPEGADLHLVKQKTTYDSTPGSPGRDEFLNALKALGIVTGPSGRGENFYAIETRILPGDELYVMGTVAENARRNGPGVGSGNICIRKQKGTVFCISDLSERQLLTKLKKQLFYCFGIGLFWVSIYLVLIWWVLAGSEISKRLCGEDYNFFCG